jgi:hypothetical protein
MRVSVSAVIVSMCMPMIKSHDTDKIHKESCDADG